MINNKCLWLRLTEEVYSFLTQKKEIKTVLYKKENIQEWTSQVSLYQKEGPGAMWESPCFCLLVLWELSMRLLCPLEFWELIIVPENGLFSDSSLRGSVSPFTISQVMLCLYLDLCI